MAQNLFKWKHFEPDIIKHNNETPAKMIIITTRACIRRLSQRLVCLLVISVCMVLYCVGRLIYVLMPSFTWTSAPIRQISRD